VEAQVKPYTVWMRYPSEGWQPVDCDDLEQCFREMNAVAHSGEYRITKPVDVQIIERQGN
jgi:hypothetical protein